MTDNNAGVLDFLREAVHEASYEVERSNPLNMKAWRAEADQAIAAVAERIAAVEDVYGDKVPQPRCETACQSCRIQAAIARCKGGAK